MLFLTNGFGQSIEASLTAKQYAYSDSNTLVDLYFKIKVDHFYVNTSDSLETIDVNVNYRFKKDELYYGDNLKVSVNFKDLWRKEVLYRASVVLNPGDYDLEIRLSDANNPLKQTEFSTVYNVENKYDEKISEIFLFNKSIPATKDHIFYKMGFALFPKFQNPNYLFNKNDSILNYYVEVYDLVSDKKMFLERFIRPKARVNAIKETYKVKELKQVEKKVESGSINIADLPSGNYEIVLTVFDEQKNILKTESVLFQRINPILEKTSIKTFKKDAVRELFKKTLVEKYNLNDAHKLNQLIAALSLKMPKDERGTFYNIIDHEDLKVKQNFFISYWEENNSFHPQTAIEKFINTFELVQNRFAYRKADGYKTDKGRVYLEYGKPDDIEKKSTDNRSAPYEIWHYFKLNNGQGNIIFVFNEESNSGEFRLIHSNAVEEINNPNWDAINRSLNSSN